MIAIIAKSPAGNRADRPAVKSALASLEGLPSVRMGVTVLCARHFDDLPRQ